MPVARGGLVWPRCCFYLAPGSSQCGLSGLAIYFLYRLSAWKKQKIKYITAKSRARSSGGFHTGDHASRHTEPREYLGS